MKKTLLGFLLGTFFIGGLFILSYITIISSPESIFLKQEKMIVKFEKVGNISIGSNIIYKGVKIGKILSFKLSDNLESVEVIMGLKEAIAIYEGYQIVVKPRSLFGGVFVYLDRGDINKKRLNLPFYKGELEISVTERAVTLFEEFRERAKDLEPSIKNIEKITEKIKDFITTIDNKKITKILSDIEKVTNSISGSNGTLGKLLNDKEGYDKIIKLVNQFSEILQDIQEQTPVNTVSNIVFGAL